MAITERPYRDDADRDRMLRFLSAANVADAPRRRYWHPGGDIIWNMYQNTEFDPYASFQLWEEDSELVGIGWLEEPADFTFQVHPRLLGDEALAEAMLAWGIRRSAHASGESGDALRVYVRSQFAEHVALLERHGYVRDTRTPLRLVERRGYSPDGYYMVHFQRDLRDLPEPEAPADWVVRPVGGEDEWPERVELHRTVWAPSRVTFEAYRRLRAAPVYHPDLDFVAVAPDGRLASYCICWLDPITRVAEFEPVGTHPDFRGQGIGRLLLLGAFQRLREAGAETAIVLTNSVNMPAVRLYESAGFTVADTEYVYTKSL